ncbi:MAG: Tryptophan synthase beta chain 1 [Candidatus Heimdallarchaeota archaeon LC_3]|nr:MAG: Tryptophan synthase beta chain 1 [Candidatus Heimdallarchaeota archaeon LC_3]OLS26532.1 MAG: Tryptophan synthase beta chain 1 [Candidatus Heimdallarchaeota archaeon LC_3]
MLEETKRKNTIRIDLSIEDIPKNYYNILSDFGNLSGQMAPPLHPGTKLPIGPQDLAPLFPLELIKQEVSAEKYIPIPEEVRDIYARYRPSPVFRAERFEAALKTSAKIYFKYEGVSPPGSHKPNTAIAQAYYNAKEGVEKLYTETGAGQWGTALAYAGQFFDLDIEVFMVKISYDQKPQRRTVMEMYGAKVHPSPSNITEIGKKILGENPDHPGSLGTAISEAIEKTMSSENCKYSLGSVLNHVLLHQTIIGQEAQTQLESINEKPDIIIGCLGGGSNFGGLAFPFLEDKLQGKTPDLKVIAVESTAAPKLTQGEMKYDFGDTGQMTPLLRMYTVGHKFIPAPVHAGGLRYHGSAPTVSHLLENKIIEAEAYSQQLVFDAAHIFTKAEGIIPAPESAHAVASTIEQARQYPKDSSSSEGPVILFNLSGHGLLDLLGYQNFLSNKLQDFQVNHQMIKESMAQIPQI